MPISCGDGGYVSPSQVGMTILLCCIPVRNKTVD
jgi:hypothetical protein